MTEKTEYRMRQLGTPSQGLMASVGIFILFIGTYLLGNSLGATQYLAFVGISPLNAEGLLGVFFSPFGHASVQHLLINTIPLMFLSYGLVLLRGYEKFLTVFLITMLGSGIFTWLIAPPDSLTVGASGIVSGLAIYLCILSGLRRDFVIFAITGMLSTLVIISIVSTILANDSTSSWQAHIGGVLVGVVLACLDELSSRKMEEEYQAQQLNIGT